MFKKISWLLLLLLLPPAASALGLGEIRVHSLLHQPLDAAIDLWAVDPAEIPDVHVALASPSAFDKAGLDRSYLLTYLRFKAEVAPNGKAVIRVYSHQTINEPYLNFLLKIDWRGGTLIREYAILLDPSTYHVRKAMPAAQTAVLSVPVAPSTRQPLSPVTPRIYGPVRAAETLWEIAEKVRPRDVDSIEQVLLALQVRNPDAFLNHNINQLKSGAMLVVPEVSEMNAISAVEARARFLQQTRIWRATQNDMMPQSSVAADTKTTQSGVESGSYESDRLKIAEAGFTAGNNSVSVLPESTTTPQELHTAITEATRDLATAREVNRQLEQLRTSLEGEIEGLRKELQERDAVIQKLLQRLNESEGGKSSFTGTGPGEGQSNSKAVQRVMPPADGYAALRTDKPVETNSADQATEGGAAWYLWLLPSLVVLLAAVLLFLWWNPRERRLWAEGNRKFLRASVPDAQAEGDPLNRYGPKPEIMQESELTEIEQLLDSAESPDEPMTVSAKGDQQLPLGSEIEEEGPPYLASSSIGAILTEADVYLIYRQYGKAEQLVRDGMVRHPGNHQLEAKLLEILGFRGAKQEFALYLEEVGAAIREHAPALWQRIYELGQKVLPDHPLLQEQDEFISIEDDDLVIDNILLDEKPETRQEEAHPPGTREQEPETEDIGWDAEIDLDDIDELFFPREQQKKHGNR